MIVDCSHLRRFILFGGCDYEACGGFDDVRSSHDTLDEANLEGKRLFLTIADDGHLIKEVDWWHVWDCDSRRMVAESTEADHQEYLRLFRAYEKNPETLLQRRRAAMALLTNRRLARG